MEQTQPKYTKAYLLKTGAIVLLLLVESYLLTSQIIQFVKTGNYFSFQVQNVLFTFLLMLFLIYTYALSVGSWKKWEQFVVVPLPICVGVFLAYMNLELYYAVVSCVLMYLLIVYEISICTLVKKQLIKFKPRLVLGSSSKRLLLMFALLSASIFFANAVERPFKINVGELVGKMSGEYLTKYISAQMGNLIPDNSLPKGVNLNDYGFSPKDLGIGASDIEDMVATQVNTFLEPYKNFVTPLIATIVFGYYQMVAIVVGIVYLVTVDLIFLLFKKVGFFKVKHMQIEQETVEF